MTSREVVLDGGSPWGFRLHGGADVNQPLRISRVNPGSKAALRGIREGDFITSINNQSTKDISNAEAHALLRNSGDTLKLGLNEEVSGSPKRRQYKTVHQETHSETVKKSSTTSYTVTSSKTVETSNELQTSKVNGNTNNGVNGDTYDHPKNSIASQRPTLSSNSTSSSSYTSLTSPSGSDMADNARSRRRRRNNNRRKARQSLNTTEIIVEENIEVCDVDETKKDYRVESPERIRSPEAKKPIKSRSLDDDDAIKIQELSEVSENEDKSECKAIISEAESDIEWEITSSIEEPEVSSCTSTLNVLTLPLEQHTTEQVSLMSPEEELSLRNFLEGLNLVNSPEDAFRQIRDFSTMESVKTTRAKKRAALEQYFIPIMQNPRFLDVINEEAGDVSDREVSVTQHLKQGTPEPEIPQGRPPRPELPQGRPPRSRRVIDNPTILVGTKIIDVPLEMSTASYCQARAEVVFLDDSSNSSTPDPKSDDDDKSGNDDLLSSANSSVPDLRESEVVEETKQVRVTVKKNDVLVTSSDNVEGVKRNRRNETGLKVEVCELTPPPTPDDVSPKNETVKKNEGVSIIEEPSSRRDGRIFDQDIRILDLTARDESEGPEVIKGKILFSVPNRTDWNSSRSEVGTEKIKSVNADRNLRDKEKFLSSDISSREEVAKCRDVDVKDEQESEFVQGLGWFKTELASGKIATELEKVKRELEDMEMGNKSGQSESSDVGTRGTIVAQKQEKIIDIEIEKESKDAQNRINNLTTKNISSPIELEKEKLSDMAMGKESTFQNKYQLFENRNILFNPSNMPTRSEARRERIVDVKLEEDCLSVKDAQETSKSIEIPNEIEVNLEEQKENKNVRCEAICKKSEIPIEKIIEVKLDNQDGFKDLCSGAISKNKEDTKERIIEIEIEKESKNIPEQNQTKHDKEKMIEVKMEKANRFSDDLEVHSEDAAQKLDETKENFIKIELETETRSAHNKNKSNDFVIKDIPKKPEATKERIIEVKLEERNDFVETRNSLFEDTSKNQEIPKEKIIDIRMEHAQDTDRNSNILDFSSKNTPQSSECTKHNESKFAQNRNYISEDINKKSEVAKERIIKIEIERADEKFNTKDTANTLEASKETNTNLEHTDFSNKLEAPKERIINVEIEKSMKDQDRNISFEDLSSTPADPKERIIRIEVEGESRSAQEQVRKSETLESTSGFEKLEDIKERKIEMKVEDTKSAQTYISEASSHQSECPKTRTIDVKIQQSTCERAQGDTAKDFSQKSEVPTERIINVEIENSSSAQKKTEVTTSTSGQSLQKPEAPKERIIDVIIEDAKSVHENVAKNVFQKSEVVKEKNNDVIIESLKYNQNKTQVASPIDAEGSRERIIDVKIEGSSSASTFGQSLQKPIAQKERIINVTIESEPVNSSENVFQKSDAAKEKVTEVRTEALDSSRKTRTTTSTDKFQKTEKPVEKIIDVKIEKAEATTSTSRQSFHKPEAPKERIIGVTIEDCKPVQSNVSKNVFQRLDGGKEKIIEVKIESNQEKIRVTTPIESFQRVERPRERIIDVKIEDASITSENTFQKSEISKEKLIEHFKSAEKKNQDIVCKDFQKSEATKARIIKVKVEHPSQLSGHTPKDSPRKIEKILKLDDLTPPIVLTPTSPKFSERNIFVNVEPKSDHRTSTDATDSITTKKQKEESISNLESFLDRDFEKMCKRKESEETEPHVRIELEGLSTLKSLLNEETKKVDFEEMKEKELLDDPFVIKVESPSEEVENICTKTKQPESVLYTNILSPTAPSPSPSLSSGSSRATSLCTAKYNSMSSSLADITSINEDFSKGTKYPLTLRELCVGFLMGLPFGRDILQELADVSSSIEHLTRSLISEGEDRGQKWIGVSTDEDPRLLLCLSPTQKIQLDKSGKMREEASKLLDLHQKYIYRASYHDPAERQAKSEQIIKPRLLAIIRDAQEPRIKKFSTLPRNMESARLKAKDLSEWLKLARSKSHSEWDLTDENTQNAANDGAQRRKSLPDIYERQMRYLQEKEEEIQKELEMLEEEKRQLSTPRFRVEDYHISKKGDFAETRKSRPLSMPVSTEFFRQQMYEEYMDQIAAREERKQHKVVKVSQFETQTPVARPSGLENEFMDKVKEKQKLGKLDSGEANTEDESEETVPQHLREFLEIAETGDGVWSPGQKQEIRSAQIPKSDSGEEGNEPLSPVWTPKSATSSPTVERKEFRPVKFESPVLGRKNYQRNEDFDSGDSSKEPPWRIPETSSDTGIVLSSTLEKRLPTSHSSPACGFNDFPTTRLPRAQNPTITLLQKAREGQLPKGALYIEQEQHSLKRHQNERPPVVGPGEILYKIKNEYTSESDSERPRKMADLGPRKYEGIGPTTKDGMPLILRSEVKDANQSKWYKKMYDTIHKQRPHRDEYVTVRYKQRRGQYPYTSGYLSEPEPGAYDSDFADYKYATLDRRRVPRDKENDYAVSSTMPRSAPDKVGSSVVKHAHDPYKNQPGRIENYITGHSSISEKEAKEWWDEVMDIFDGHLEQQKRVPQTKSFINQALKESGYESDSTLVFRRRDDTAQQLSPSEQKAAYKTIQKGGDVPLYGLRKPAPERPKEPEPPVPPPKGQHALRNQQPESPRKYVENEVTIHYKTPVRQEIKEYLSEDELAYRQAEAMKKIYQEERRRKYLQVSKSLQELQDMNSRRHADNFIPSQKSPIPLNRYDDLDDLAPPVKPRPRSPEPRLMARALYNFVGQTARELTFRKGDIIYVRRQVDKNWYEGELNAMVGLFPVNYVEIVTYDAAKPTPRKSHEGQARAKYNFVAQTHLELSLAKGELVVITRRVDDNWFEGKIGGRKGIFPVSYVDVLIDANDPPPPPQSSGKPVAAPAAHSMLLNGSAGGKESMGSHSYTPNLSSNQLTSSYHAKPVHVTGSYGSVTRGAKNPVSQALHIETQAEPIPYRALYKYLPQNDDELELFEGDTVYVLEKCDDGWYVGSSDRTGAFGTFPGNYVEKI